MMQDQATSGSTGGSTGGSGSTEGRLEPLGQLKDRVSFWVNWRGGTTLTFLLSLRPSRVIPSETIHVYVPII